MMDKSAHGAGRKRNHQIRRLEVRGVQSVFYFHLLDLVEKKTGWESSQFILSTNTLCKAYLQVEFSQGAVFGLTAHQNGIIDRHFAHIYIWL